MKTIKSHSHAKGWVLVAIIMALFVSPMSLSAQDEVATATPTIAELAASVAENAVSLDTVWVLLAAMLVFFMQPGFALVEAGFTRTKNTANILMKNLLDFSIGTVLFWLVGYSIMFGVGGFMGMPDLLGSFDWSYGVAEAGLPSEGFMIFQTVFCATAATIVSGAMAERTKFHCYIIYSILISLFIYPVSGHWTWGGGWLAELGFHDFAGSTVVHSVGGWIALVGAAIIGPRIGKYKKGKATAIPGHNLTIAALGVFILWFGWFGFNPGSQLAAAGSANSTAIAHVFFTTNIAAACGGLAAMGVSWLRDKKPSLSLTLNGILAGLVGITAGCDYVDAFGAAMIGLICGVVMVFAVSFIENVLKIDDPVGASSVHGVCGALGTLLTGLFSMNGMGTDDISQLGLFYGGGMGFLTTQAIGVVVVGAWAAGMAFIVFKLIDVTIGLRVKPRIEEEGLDIYEHGESAYN
ncbi:MAG: ammonium transporter [Bacteroidales bacterium]